MFRRKNLQNERGSVEVVILVVVVAAIVGLVAWRIAETQKTQIDTQAAIENSDTAPGKPGELVAAGLGLKMTVPNGNGTVTLASQTGGDMASVELTSKRLKEAEYTCDGENSGVFGTLGVVDTAAGAPRPSYTKEVDAKMFGFVSTLTENCYSDELMTAFRETVPKAIVESLETTRK